MQLRMFIGISTHRHSESRVKSERFFAYNKRQLARWHANEYWCVYMHWPSLWVQFDVRHGWTSVFFVEIIHSSWLGVCDRTFSIRSWTKLFSLDLTLHFVQSLKHSIDGIQFSKISRLFRVFFQLLILFLCWKFVPHRTYAAAKCSRLISIRQTCWNTYLMPLRNFWVMVLPSIATVPAFRYDDCRCSLKLIVAISPTDCECD